MAVLRSAFVLPLLTCGLGFCLPAFAVDCNENGSEDATEVLEGTAPDCNLNGFPDECDILEVICRPFVENERLSGLNAAGITVADLDGDGDDDAVLAGRTVDVVLNRGDGTFTAPVSHAIEGLQPSRGSVADMDGNGTPDFVVVASLTELAVLPGDGRGAFGEPLRVTWEAADFAETLNAFGDIDRDGDADIINYGPAIVLARNQGGGKFEVEPLWSLDAPARANSVVLLDLEGDADLDLVASVSTNELLVFRNAPGGSFAAPEAIPTPRNSLWVEAADLDGDEVLDLLVAHPGDSQFSLFRNDAGTLVPGPVIPSPQQFTLPPRASDLDGDGDVDIIVPGLPVEDSPSRAFLILEQQGAGEFQPALCSVELEPRLRELTPIQIEPFFPDASRSREMDLLVWNYNHRFGLSGGPFVFRRRAETRSADCDRNGVPDECQAELRRCRDCNQNGIPDADDIASGESADENGNGIPDSCEGPGPRFEFRFEAPNAVQGSADSTVLFFADVEVHSKGYPAGEPGLQGWVFLVTADEAEIVDVTVEGTVAAPAPDGIVLNGFEMSGFLPPPRPGQPPCAAQVAAVVVLSFQHPITLDITESPSRVLRLAVETTAPAQSVKTATLSFPSDPCQGPTIPAPGDRFPEDGGGATGGFLHPQVVYRGDSGVDSSFYPKDVLVYARDPVFHRGDANDDGRLDISDVIRIANKLFIGGVTLGCRNAADANDDARLDVSDVIAVAAFLFTGGRPPRPPGPPGPGAVCGPDRPGEINGDQGCEFYLSCT